jgi:hypothetical protein
MTGMLIGMIPVGLKVWLGIKNDQSVQSGQFKQESIDATAALKNATDAQVIAGDVDRMSDQQLRDSPYANRRD